MNKYNLTFIVLIVCLGLLFLDLQINDYNQKFILQPAYLLKDSDNEINTTKEINKPKEQTPDLMVSINNQVLAASGFEDLVITAPVETGKIFDVIYGQYPKVYLTGQIIKKGDKQAVKVYELRSAATSVAELYAQVLDQANKTAAQLDNLTLNAGNEYGKQSFYLNDLNRKNMAFLVVQIPKSVLAFEYPKANHELIVKILAEIK